MGRRTYTVSSQLDPGTYCPGTSSIFPLSGVLYGIAHDAEDPAALHVAAALVGYHARLGATRFGVEASRRAVASGAAPYFSQLAAVITNAGLAVVYLHPEHPAVESAIALHHAALQAFSAFTFDGLQCRFTMQSIQKGIRLQAPSYADVILRIVNLRSGVATYHAVAQLYEQLTEEGHRITHDTFVIGVLLYWMLQCVRFDGRVLMEYFAELTQQYNTILADALRASRPDIAFVGHAHTKPVADATGILWCNVMRHTVDTQGHARPCAVPARALQDDPLGLALRDCGHRFGWRAADPALMLAIVAHFLARQRVTMNLEEGLRQCVAYDPLWMDRCHYIAMSNRAAQADDGATNVRMMELAHLTPTTTLAQSLLVTAALHAMRGG